VARLLGATTVLLVSLPDVGGRGPEPLDVQVRSKSGVVLRVEPTMPKLGLGVVGKESWRVYQ
jgi:hypothetical protein